MATYINHKIYQDGTVTAVAEKSGKLVHLKGTITDKGYRKVSISGKAFKVHRLVAQAFIPNPNNLATVDHIDGNKLNNNVANLRWMSFADNTRAVSKHKHAKGTTPVEIKVNGKVYPSIREAAKYIQSACGRDVTLDTIRRAIREYLRGNRPSWKMYGSYLIE